MRIKLEKHYFTSKEKVLVETDGLSVSVFKYDSGIEAVRLTNEVGYIVILPYHGQMIWDAYFYDRSLKMQTPFQEPVVSKVFGETYGCYLMHCGMTAMGGPKATDNHMPHGEIPCAEYKDAEIISGSNDRGKYIALTGTYEHNIAFDDHYITQPLVKLYESSGMLEVSVKTKNLSRKPMDLMYLCHINNRLVPDGKIYQTLPWNDECMVIQDIDENSADQDLLTLFNKIKENPDSSNPISKGDFYDPEIVFFLRNIKTDENNNAYFLYELPDGSADYTCFNTSELGHGVRWIAYHEDCEAMGIVLPATAESEGLTAEKAKGNVSQLKTNEEFSATIHCGSIPMEKVHEIKNIIDRVNQE